MSQLPIYRTRARHCIIRTLMGVAVVAGAVMLYQVDPSTTRFLPKCPVHLLTGLHCPGCGSTRAIHCLLHGDVAGAIAKNALLVLMLPLGFAYAWRTTRSPAFDWSTAIPASWICWFVLLLIAFTLARNVPA